MVTKNAENRRSRQFNFPNFSQWRIHVGLFWIMFYKNEVYEQKNGIKRVRDLSQIAGNGKFRDLNFQKFLGEHAPKPPRRLAPSALVVIPPFESPGSALVPARDFTRPAILEPWHLCDCDKNYECSLPCKTLAKPRF